MLGDFENNMRVICQPSLSDWRLGGKDNPDRAALAALVNERAARLGTAKLLRHDRLIATGHQAWLWHPGILAKDLAMTGAARRLDAGVLHLVVDQDVNEALTLDVPVRHGEALESQTLRLAWQKPGVPTGMHPPVDAAEAVATLRKAMERWGDALRVDLSSIITAFTDLPDCRNLAEQIGVVTQRLMRPWTGDVPLMLASDLTALPGFPALLRALLDEAGVCAEHYNAAVAGNPGAGITPLRVNRLQVELPLWILRPDRPRQPAFADVGDSTPLLTDEAGESVELNGDKHDAGSSDVTLAPKALLLTAMMRSVGCDLFVHGKGGGIYDRLTEIWWRNWRGQELAPMTVASADLHLPFDAPLASREDVARAIWLRHHLPHNLDRYLCLDTKPAKRKLELLAHMDDDRDKRRRAAAFTEIHAINAALAQVHPEALAAADAALATARAGLRNRSLTQRRDWCFALYPPEALDALLASLENGVK